MITDDRPPTSGYFLWRHAAELATSPDGSGKNFRLPVESTSDRSRHR
jgi:hypothetical protein